MPVVDVNGREVIRLAILTPCQDTVTAGYAYDLARLVGHITSARPDIQLSYHQNRGTIIPQQRAVLVRAAMEAKATHVLWIDSDMRFPPDAFFQLLADDEPIVAANYPTRRPPILPTAEHSEHGYLFTPADADGLDEVTRCGMGLMLVRMHVYESIKQPWFVIGFSPSDAEYTGEDFFFCQQARNAGFTIWIDQALSKSVKHGGAMEFTAQHACTTRDVYAQSAEVQSVA